MSEGEWTPKPVTPGERNALLILVGIALVAATAMTFDCLFFEVCGTVNQYGEWTYISPISQIFQGPPQ